VSETASACEHVLIAFDFERKTETTIDLADAAKAVQAGQFLWLDLLASDAGQARALLTRLDLFSDLVIDDALSGEEATRHARYDDYLHIVVCGCRPSHRSFELERVDIILGQSFMATIHRQPALFMDAVRRDYRSDFHRFAKSPSFMLYELWDHLLENYLAVQRDMEERVEALQLQLGAGKVDENIFAVMSTLSSDLLHLRKVLLPARAVLVDLSTRKSLYISDATQGFLHNMVGTLEHVLQDLLVDRDILSESLNLYMSMVSFRTNRVMTRLTIVSVVFLPLTFLVGIYGMNFDGIPELHWEYGYAYFWGVVVLITLILRVFLKRAKIL
jgi:magnesium transporter